MFPNLMFICKTGGHLNVFEAFRVFRDWSLRPDHQGGGRMGFWHWGLGGGGGGGAIWENKKFDLLSMTSYD
jgi:hypothetical protein